MSDGNRRRRAVAAGFGLAFCLTGMAAAAAPKSQPAPAGQSAPDRKPEAAAAPSETPGQPVPERTTAVFGDWSMSCVQPADGVRSCEASLTVQDQQRKIGLVLAIGRPAKGQPLLAVLQVPANIRTAEPVQLELDEEAVLLPFYQCNRLGCFAQLELKDDSFVRRLRAHNPDTPGRIKWHDSSNTEIVAPLSTRGFGAAMDSLIASDNGKR